jgi:hypothetical protein
MPEDDPYTRFVTVRAKPPPLTSGATLHWDGMSAMSRSLWRMLTCRRSGRRQLTPEPALPCRRWIYVFFPRPQHS